MLLSGQGRGSTLAAGSISVIQEGDLVIVYESHDRMKAVKVSAKERLQNRFGSFKHSDWIRRPFGSKVRCWWRSWLGGAESSADKKLC